MKSAPKLLAEWFWTDRWSGSSAFGLPLEARGLYREMLSQAWRRGARLPNDPETIRRLIGASEKEWEHSWPLVARYWRVDGDDLVNDTQVSVYAEALSRHENASNRGRAGAGARWSKRQGDAQASPEQSTGNADAQTGQSASGAQAIASDLRSPISELHTAVPRMNGLRAPSVLSGALHRDHRSHAWCGGPGGIAMKCVPEFLHREFLQALNGEADPEAILQTFYADTDREARNAAPNGQQPPKFWRSAFERKFPGSKAAPSGTPARRPVGAGLSWDPAKCKHIPHCGSASRHDVTTRLEAARSEREAAKAERAAS